MAISKIIFGNSTLLDLTADTVVADKLLSGYTAHGADGNLIEGSCTYDSDTTDATAAASEILATKTAYVDGNKVTGTMPNRGGVSGTISTVNGEYAIQNGYHDGSGTVGIDPTEIVKLQNSDNLKSGVTILGVTGTYTGEEISAETISVTPYTTAQTILPDSGYDYLAQVNVAAIAYSEVDNASGGKTVTIGAVAPAEQEP